MTESMDLDMYRPAEARLEMPYQVLEPAPVPRRSWADILRLLVGRRASHE